jgi:hypothetical protein
MQVHELVIGERAHDPIAPKAAEGAELVVATAADCAQPAATARRGGI